MRKDQLERWRTFKTCLEIYNFLFREHVLRERGFVERLNESHESHMKRLSDTHREKVALLDRQFLQQKQQLMRAREAALWEMEERQLHERGTSLPRPKRTYSSCSRTKWMMEKREEKMGK